MPTKPLRLPYQPAETQKTDNPLPLLLLTLNFQRQSVKTIALLDSGASVNVLPYSIGLQLGAVWEQQTMILKLGGNLAAAEARGLLLSATITSLEPVRLVFAWAKSDNLPVILGQMNFFQTFDICFFGTEMIFEIQPKRRRDELFKT